MAGLGPHESPRGVEAARRVMLELWSILGEYRDTLTLVGGSTPPLLVGDVPGDPYTGTLDVDLIVDPLGVPEETYRTIAESLRERGYWQEPQPKQPFQWFRRIDVDGQPITVEVDLLAPSTARTGRKHRHEQIEGEPLARRTLGADWCARHTWSASSRDGSPTDGRIVSGCASPRLRSSWSSRRLRWPIAISRRTPTISTTCWPTPPMAQVRWPMSSRRCLRVNP